MSKVNANFKIEGIVAAPATPLKDNGDLDLERVKDYVDFLVANSITGVFILGTLGEGMSLTVSERKQVTQAWVKYGIDRLQVIAHIGAGNLRDSIDLSRHAQQVGVTALACMSPSYFRPANEAIMVDYLEQVAAAAPDTPFYYYCINFMTDVNLNTAKILELADGRIPNLRGVKMSSRELPSLLDCTSVCGGKFDVMIGSDEQLLTSVVLGVRTPIVSSYMGNIVQRLREAFDVGDWETARTEQTLARKIMLISHKYGTSPAFGKAVLKCLGLPLGPVRLPVVDLTPELVENLKNDLAECDLSIRWS
ncbi:N-acetylneuraminate lyase [Biomphalaria glabrata]|nr:N-acetylneuraminate lyase [Biomphalaria glabrata]